MSSDRILVITGDLHLYLAICRYSQSLGLHSHVTGDALYALLQAVEDVPRLVIIDSATDGIDSVALCEMLQLDPLTRDTPIIVLAHPLDKNVALLHCKPGIHLVLMVSHRELLPHDLEQILGGQLDPRLACAMSLHRQSSHVKPPIALN
jgi:PleD family two-component response regulator